MNGLEENMRQYTKQQNALREELCAFINIIMGDEDKGILSSEKEMPKEENKGMEDRGFESKGLLHTHS